MEGGGKVKLLAMLKRDFHKKEQGQTLGDFAKEYKELSEADKLWYANAYKAEGETPEDYA